MPNPYLQYYVSWPRPAFIAGQYNIMDRSNGRIMLGVSVDIINALWYLEYYCNRYGCEMFGIIRTGKGQQS